MPSEWNADLYDPETDETRYRADPDPVSEGVGSVAFVDRFVLEDCQETFPESRVARFPEIFDRYYFNAAPPVLIDILHADTAGEMDEQVRLKRVEFKTQWCEANGRRYVALTESEALNAQAVRERLYGTRQPTVADVVPEAPAPRRKGGIERPKAVPA